MKNNESTQIRIKLILILEVFAIIVAAIITLIVDNNQNNSLKYGNDNSNKENYQHEPDLDSYSDSIADPEEESESEPESVPEAPSQPQPQQRVWRCVDATSYDKNPYNDNYCTNGVESRYVSDSQAVQLDPSYSPGKSGHYYYNSK